MSYYVLWVDHDHAKIFQFSPNGDIVKHLNNTHHMNHHTSHQDREKLEQRKKFYKDIEGELHGARGILVVGPDHAKNDFKRYLEEHHDRPIAQSIVGMETMTKLSDGQIRDFAKKYFHTLNLFQ